MHSAAALQLDESAIRDINSIEVDEKALREAVASRTLTWLTGSSSNNDYISVGRKANFFGFVGLRVASGQSLSRSDVANDTLTILTASQRDVLVELLEEQKQPFQKTQEARYKINRALEGLLVNESISRDAFLALGREYGSREAELGRIIGDRLGYIVQSLTSEQRSALSDIRSAHISGQGGRIKRQPLKLKLPHEDKKELVNLAARLLSWTTGSPEYNDFEVVGKPSQHFGFVSLRIDSNHGVKRGDVAKEVWDLLTPDQQQLLAKAAEQNTEEFSEFLSVRAQLMRTLEVALSGDRIDTSKVYTHGAAVGAIEASMTWAQAMAMIKVRNKLTDVQASDLLAVRAKYTAGAQNELPGNSLDRGRQLFAQCSLCHDSTKPSAVAPQLTGIVGRRIADDASFDGYSHALRAYADTKGVWSEMLLDRFLKSPRSLVPGTYMGFDGLEEERDRSALIEYLKTIKQEP